MPIDPGSVYTALEHGGNQVAERAVEGVFNLVANKMPSVIEKGAKGILDRAVVSFQVGFKEYLRTSYARCDVFKTMLSPNVPLSLAEYYQHISLTCGDENLRDEDLISDLHNRRAIVVSGLAGSGKSMFMRYLTISMFRQSRGKIPLFVDLRHVNNLSNRRLLTFIRAYCSTETNRVTEDQFRLGLQAGLFVLILDGFDEINHDHRSQIEADIFDLRKNYPDTSVIVSSRPDSTRFGSWTSFQVFSVDRLNKKQSLELIDSLPYDRAVKSRFLREVRRGLYESHVSFLSSPLLITIMLLTYEEFANIPQKMHSFYSQAFDTLFQKHDAMKDQFVRKTKTGLPREEFKLCFSAFCAMSYLEETFSFSEDNLARISEKALDYTRKNGTQVPEPLTPQDLIDDLHDAVCMLHKDGVESAFVHRSFQEYFAARFVTGTHNETKRILDRYSVRFNDSVIPMAFEIDREGMEQRWVVPAIEDLIKKLTVKRDGSNFVEVLTNLFPGITIYSSHPHQADKDNILWAFSDVDFTIVGPIEVLRRQYSDICKGLIFPGIDRTKRARLKSLCDSPERGRSRNFDKIEKFINRVAVTPSHIRIRLVDEDAWWLQEIGARRMLSSVVRTFRLVKNNIEERAKSKTNLLEEFFPA